MDDSLCPSLEVYQRCRGGAPSARPGAYNGADAAPDRRRVRAFTLYDPGFCSGFLNRGRTGMSSALNEQVAQILR